MFAVKASVVLAIGTVAAVAAAAPASLPASFPARAARSPRALRGLGAPAPVGAVHDEGHVSAAKQELKRIFSGKACEGEASEQARLACFKQHLRTQLPPMLQSLQAEDDEEAKLEQKLKDPESDAFASSRAALMHPIILPAAGILEQITPNWYWTPFKTVRKSLSSAGEELVNWVFDGAAADSEYAPTGDKVLEALETFGTEFGDGVLNMLSFGYWKPCGEGEGYCTTPEPETETEKDANSPAPENEEKANTPAPENEKNANPPAPETKKDANTPAPENEKNANAPAPQA